MEHVKKVLTEAGVDIYSYSRYSFYIGAATTGKSWNWGTKVGYTHDSFGYVMVLVTQELIAQFYCWVPFTMVRYLLMIPAGLLEQYGQSFVSIPFGT